MGSGTPPMGGTATVAAATTGDGVQAVIKLAIPGNDLAGETTVLRLAKGHAYARKPWDGRCSRSLAIGCNPDVPTDTRIEPERWRMARVRCQPPSGLGPARPST